RSVTDDAAVSVIYDAAGNVRDDAARSVRYGVAGHRRGETRSPRFALPALRLDERSAGRSQRRSARGPQRRPDAEPRFSTLPAGFLTLPLTGFKLSVRLGP